MKNNKARYIAGCCFMVLVLWSLVNLIRYDSFGCLIELVGFLLVAISLLVSVPVLSTIGFAIMFVYASVLTVDNIASLIIDGGLRGLVRWISLSDVIPLAFAVYALLLVVASFRSKSAKTLGISATGVALVRVIMIAIYNSKGGYGITINTILWNVLIMCGAILFGFVQNTISTQKQSKQSQMAEKTNHVSDEISNLEKIVKLKKMLDAGILTEEEFNAKKKQFLGL